MSSYIQCSNFSNCLTNIFHSLCEAFGAVGSRSHICLNLHILSPSFLWFLMQFTGWRRRVICPAGFSLVPYLGPSPGPSTSYKLGVRLRSVMSCRWLLGKAASRVACTATGRHIQPGDLSLCDVPMPRAVLPNRKEMWPITEPHM